MKIYQHVKGVILPIASVFLLLCGAGPVLAGPASPQLLTLTNPDGTSFKARIRGDEFQNWTETENGYSVVRSPSSKYWEYAEKASDGKLRNSGVVFKPNAAPPSAAPKGLKPDRNTGAESGLERMIKQIHKKRQSSSRAEGAPALGTAAGDWVPTPVSGKKNVLIILVNFADRTLVTKPSGWSGAVFDTSSGAKSMANFYTQNSYGGITISPATHSQTNNPTGVVTVSISDKHPNSGGGDMSYETETTILNHALSQAAKYVDFAGYDANGDGIIEQSELSVYFIYAGYEASGSQKTPSIWAHAWGGDPGLAVAGKNITGWAQNGELNDSGVQHPMGVIAHEMGHSLCGLPDLYDTSYHNAGLGIFSLMSGGSWGADTNEYAGTTPVTLDAWSRQYLGWATPVIPSSSDSLILSPPLSFKSSSYKFIDPSVSDTEYFLAENRYPTGWDAGMKIQMGNDWNGGLLILHVDITSGTQGSNDINKYGVSSHQGVMAEEADSSNCSLVSSDCGGDSKTLFFSGNKDAFGNSTTPSSKYYSGASSKVEISSISTPGEIMQATYSTGTTTASSSVSNNTPTDGAKNISTKTRVTVSFSTDIDQATLNSSTFYLSRGGNPVAGAISYDVATRTATFTPDSQLFGGAKYTATVTSGIMDLDGKSLASGKSWSFTTRRGWRF